MVPGALGLLDELGQRGLGLLEVGPGEVHLGSDEPGHDHPLGGQFLVDGFLHLLEGGTVDHSPGGEAGEELLPGNHRGVVDELLEDLFGHPREGHFHSSLEWVPVEHLLGLVPGPPHQTAVVLPFLKELFPGNGALLGVTGSQGDRLGGLGPHQSQFVHRSSDLLGPGGEELADPGVDPFHLVEVLLDPNMDPELGPQSMGSRQTVDGTDGHLVVVEGLGVEGAGRSIRSNADILEDGVTVEVWVEGPTGAVLEDGEEELGLVKLATPLPSPGMASHFLSVAEGFLHRIGMDALDGLPVLRGGLGPQGGDRLGHGEGHVPTPGPFGRTGVLDELLGGDRMVPGEEGLEGLGLDDVVLLNAKMAQCLPVPPTLGFTPVEVVVLTGQLQVVVTPGGTGDFGEGEHGSSPFLGSLPLGGARLRSCLFGIGDEDRGGGVNPPLGSLALMLELLEFLGDDEQALGHLLQLALVVGQPLAGMEAFQDILPGDVRLFDAMNEGLLGQVRMDLQIDPKRQWLSGLWHV